MSNKISISVGGKVTHISKTRTNDVKEEATVTPVQAEKKTSTKKAKKAAPVEDETVADE